MDRRNQPIAFWGDSIGFWCRLWQVQFEHSLRLWGACAAGFAKPRAAELSAEAETLKTAGRPATKARRGADAATRSARPARAARTRR